MWPREGAVGVNSGLPNWALSGAHQAEGNSVSAPPWRPQPTKSRGCSGSVCSFVPFWCWNKPGDSYDAENLICLIKRELGEVLMAWSHGNRLHSLAERPVDRHFCFCFWKLRWWTPLWGCLPWQWAGSLVNPQGSRAAPQPGSSLTELSPCWESGSFLITRGK